ncbi:hypothetical protein E4T56_gene13187 [Termitomyces sp. T112]|nr:hypothetical protein E4T56_gene13187 [Termitomyces sp. T112]
MIDPVKDFNALPCPPLAPSSKVPNHWHFDLRYVTLEPPAHVLFLVQLDSSFVHMERLPYDVDPTSNETLFYFPESSSAAAPVVCKALIHSFLDGFGIEKFTKDVPAPYAPFKLTTGERSLAHAVEEEFQCMGVRRELCRIEIASGNRTHVAVQAAFNRIWERLVQASGLGPVATVLKAPDPIQFSNFRPAEWPRDLNLDCEAPDDFNRAVFYTRQLASLQVVENNTLPMNIRQALSGVMDLLSRKPLAVVRAEADTGNVMSAIDYALRVSAGYAGKPDREVFRRYLVVVITSDTASDLDKARAHGLLIEWHTAVSASEIRARYVHAAAHHANESVRLAGKSFSAVLWFASQTLEPLSKQTADLCVQYKGVWDAYEKRTEEISRDTAQAEKKRAKKSNRYVCAAVNCLIQADKGKLLSQCAGKCDLDKKPSYCSKECQRADWKNHKPFCKPGAACSILDKAECLPISSKTGMQGSISIPVIGPDGKPMVVSSSSMSPEMLKEIRKASEERAAQRSISRSRSLGKLGSIQIENFSLD